MINGYPPMIQGFLNQQQQMAQQQVQYQQNSQQQQMVPFAQVPQEVVDNTAPTIQNFIHYFNNKNRQHFNDYWYTRDDDAIIDGVKKVILSCQRDKYFTLRVLSFKVVKDYEEIQRLLHAKYANRTKNGKKLDNPYDYITLRDSDVSLLIINYYIKINREPDQVRIDPKTKEPEKLEGTEEVMIMLPRYVNKYYFRLQGNYYAPIFQIVDGSTYNNCTSSSKAQTVTLKTRFMPIKLYREHYDLVDMVTKEVFHCCLFASYIFSKKVDTMKYFLGRFGLYNTLEFLDLENAGIMISKTPFHPTQEDSNNSAAGYYNFLCKDKATVISVPRYIMERDQVTQSLVYTLYKGIHKYEKWDDIFDPRYWNKSLGADFMSYTLDKGISVLDSLESIYDIKTMNSIRLPEEDKSNVYRIIRWMIREFSQLRAKNNLDISTKKARMADEYIDCLIAMRMSRGIYRISDKGKSVKYSDVVKAIRIAPDYIVTTISTSNLVGYVNSVNDNDGQLAIEYTYKGISGLGDQGNGSNVPLIYRTVHPSHLGRVDLDSSTTSDPGLSGVICPMAEVYDGSFSDYREPNGWKEEFTQMLKEYQNLVGVKEAIEIKKSMNLNYDDIKEDMVKETLNTYKRLICPIIDLDGKIDYSINEEDDTYTLLKGDDKDTDIGDVVVSSEDTIRDDYEDNENEEEEDDEVPFDLSDE